MKKTYIQKRCTYKSTDSQRGYTHKRIYTQRNTHIKGYKRGGDIYMEETYIQRDIQAEKT